MNSKGHDFTSKHSVNIHFLCEWMNANGIFWEHLQNMWGKISGVISLYFSYSGLMSPLTVALWVGGSVFPWDPVTDLVNDRCDPANSSLSRVWPTYPPPYTQTHIYVSGHLYIQPAWSSRLMWPPQFSRASVLPTFLKFLSHVSDHPVLAHICPAAQVYMTFPCLSLDPSAPSARAHLDLL